jgi:hypothetical protein
VVQLIVTPPTDDVLISFYAAALRNAPKRSICLLFYNVTFLNCRFKDLERCFIRMLDEEGESTEKRIVNEIIVEIDTDM